MPFRHWWLSPGRYWGGSLCGGNESGHLFISPDLSLVGYRSWINVKAQTGKIFSVGTGDGFLKLNASSVVKGFCFEQKRKTSYNIV